MAASELGTGFMVLLGGSDRSLSSYPGLGYALLDVAGEILKFDFNFICHYVYKEVKDTPR